MGQGRTSLSRRRPQTSTPSSVCDLALMLELNCAACAHERARTQGFSRVAAHGAYASGDVCVQ